jgi:hypothetical protein
LKIKGKIMGLANKIDTIEYINDMTTDNISRETAYILAKATIKTLDNSDLATNEHVDSKILEVKTEIQINKAELKQEIADVRAEAQANKSELKQEIADVKSELKQEIAEFKLEMRRELADIRAEAEKTKLELKAEIDLVRLEIELSHIKLWNKILLGFGGLSLAILSAAGLIYRAFAH